MQSGNLNGRDSRCCASATTRPWASPSRRCRIADGGIDATLYKDGREAPIAVVQCKAWRTPVKVEPVRALGGVMHSKKVKRGVFWSLAGSSASQFGTMPFRLTFYWWTAQALSNVFVPWKPSNRQGCLRWRSKATIRRQLVRPVA
ncbi:restriction endonuclease [Paraburkholderia sp. PGU19]|uniref:restriction endonuclease n=1 Tax=Paraburkholderia sp. PGU19 TaxID=2735434 RepID=UPI001FB05F41|nr:restriction endonuclease [Paraburkholderia sp. PGU19]